MCVCVCASCHRKSRRPHPPKQKRYTRYLPRYDFDSRWALTLHVQHVVTNHSRGICAQASDASAPQPPREAAASAAATTTAAPRARPHDDDDEDDDDIGPAIPDEYTGGYAAAELEQAFTNPFNLPIR